MTPQVPIVLADLAGLVMHNGSPDVAAGERQSQLTLAAMLLSVAAEVWDGAADNLVRENRALAALLDETATEDDLKLSSLRAENARLRALLISAHVAAEAAGDAARETAIWAELVASTERRKLSISSI
jgi:septal ring factor EnvC (AmiA/AmiB activator)